MGWVDLASEFSLYFETGGGGGGGGGGGYIWSYSLFLYP